jgi:hypothetical protein
MKLRAILVSLSLAAVGLTATTGLATHEDDTSDCTIADPPGVVVTVPLGDDNGDGDLYINDRPGEGAPPGTGLLTGGGTWIYEGSNGIDGLQTDPGPADSTSSQNICDHDPDTLIF